MREKDICLGLKNYAGFGFLPAIHAGLLDCHEPGAMTAIVIFLIFAYSLLEQGRNLFFYTLFYITGISCLTAWLATGRGDRFLVDKSYEVLLHAGYLVVIAAAFFIGCVLFIDWGKSRKLEGQSRPLWIKFGFLSDAIVPSRNAFEKSLLLTVVWIVLSFFFGVFAGFLASHWPVDKHVYMMSWEMLLPGNFWHGLLLFFAYGITFSFFIIVLSVLITIFMHSEKMREDISVSLSVVQVILSALFLAYSLSMLSVLYLQFQ